MSDQDKTKLGLLLNRPDKNGWHTLSAVTADIADQYSVRNASSDSLYRDFQISALEAEKEHGRLFAWECALKPFTCDLETAERAVKILRVIDRKLTKMAETEGYPENWPEYVQRVARAIGAQFLAVAPDGHASGWHHDTPYRFFTVGEIRAEISRRIAPKTEEAAS